MIDMIPTTTHDIPHHITILDTTQDTTTHTHIIPDMIHTHTTTHQGDIIIEDEIDIKLIYNIKAK